jgi:hypothetical protein
MPEVLYKRNAGLHIGLSDNVFGILALRHMSGDLRVSRRSDVMSCAVDVGILEEKEKTRKTWRWVIGILVNLRRHIGFEKREPRPEVRKYIYCAVRLVPDRLNM